MDELLNKVIIRIDISTEGEHYLKVFTRDNSFYVLEACGDCCSESWFAEIINFKNLLGYVESVEILELSNYNTKDGKCRQEYDSVYGYKITTQYGSGQIIFRNSSNGYYGGELKTHAENTEPELTDYDCAKGYKKKNIPWKTLTDDWSA